MRQSSYLIDINLKNRPGKTLLMHGYTGAMDIVDSSLLESLKQADATRDFSSIDKSILERLVKRGYVTDKTEDEEVEYVGRMARVLAKRNQLLYPKKFTIVVTYDCNFNCPYCFEKKIVKESMPHGSWTMAPEMVDKFYAAMLEIEPNEKRRNKTISLFGGEPLLKKNRGIVEYIISKGSQLGCHFTATSNGYDLDYYGDFLGKEIKGIQVTLDGTCEIHDNRRPYGQTGKTFDKIISNIRLALDKGAAISVRINVDADNMNEVEKLDAFFNDSGLYKFKNFGAYATYISGEDNFNPNSYTIRNHNCNSIQHFNNLWKRQTMKIASERQIHSILNDAVCNNRAFMFIPCHCDSHIGSYIFDPFGCIYPCLEMIGRKGQIIGTYCNGVKWIEETKSRWFNRNIATVKECAKCKYAFLCGSGCYAKALDSEKDNICEDFQIRFENAVNIYIERKNLI